jgi:hypothetical protein
MSDSNVALWRNIAKQGRSTVKQWECHKRSRAFTQPHLPIEQRL